MAEETIPERLRETAPGAMLRLPKEVMKKAGESMLKDTPKGLTRFLLEKIPEGPGFIYDMVDVATAKDKPRALIGLAGGAIGAGLGEVVGGSLGATAGYSAGEAGSKWLYDHHDELAGQAAETARWIKDRTAHVATKAAHGFDRGKPPYSTRLR